MEILHTFMYSFIQQHMGKKVKLNYSLLLSEEDELLCIASRVFIIHKDIHV